MAKYWDEEDEKLEQYIQRQQAAQPKDGNAAGEDNGQEESQEAPVLSWYARLKNWIADLFAVKQYDDVQEVEEPARDVQHTVNLAAVANIDVRIAALKRMEEIKHTLDEYEQGIERNRNIVANIRQMYGELEEYISSLGNIYVDVDHRPLVRANTDAGQALNNIIMNIQQMPLVSRYITQQNTADGCLQPVQEEQPQPKVVDFQNELKRKNRRIDIWQGVAFVAVIIATICFQQWIYKRNEWKNAGHQEGIATAQAKINGLQEALRTANWETAHYAADLAKVRLTNSRAEIDALFHTYKDYRKKDAQIALLKKQNSRLAADGKEWSEAYEKLRKTANDYAASYNKVVEKTVAAGKKKAEKLPEIPERPASAVWNTIVAEEESSPYSPPYRK